MLATTRIDLPGRPTVSEPFVADYAGDGAEESGPASPAFVVDWQLSPGPPRRPRPLDRPQDNSSEDLP